MVSDDDLFLKSQNILRNFKSALAEKFRALFTLKNLGGENAIDEIFYCLSNDKSTLLKHECAYCLGQMKDKCAIDGLLQLLQDESQEIIVRHEAGEALAAIGDSKVISSLTKFLSHNCKELQETCYLALCKLQWLESNSENIGKPSFAYDGTCISYDTVDPTPALIIGKDQSRSEFLNLCEVTLMNSKNDLFERYKALFALRNLSSDESILIMANVLSDKSNTGEYLLKHEIAFIMGQLQNQTPLSALKERLMDVSENAMVRHESAEAIGSIIGALKESFDHELTLPLTETKKLVDYYEEILREHLNDPEPLVRDSCAVALDIADYVGDTQQFQFLNSK